MTTQNPNSDSFAEGDGVVFVVEDDAHTRDALAALFSSTAPVRSFESAEEFLRGAELSGPSCLLVDQRLPGMSGSDLIRRLKQERRDVSAVLVTAYADTPSTVEAMRNGALTVLDKPCGDLALREAVRLALEEDRRRVERARQREAAAKAIETLSENEREVLTMVLDGMPNKQIARRMSVCVRTIESRRSKIYQTTGVTSVAGLVRLCVLAGFIDA